MERDSEDHGLQPIGKTLEQLAALGIQNQRLSAEAAGATPVTLRRRKPPSPQIPPASPTYPPANSGPRCAHCGDNGAMLIQPDSTDDRHWMVIDSYRVSERLCSLLVVCPHCAAGQDRAKRWSNLPLDAEGVYLDTMRAIPHQDQVAQAIEDLLVQPRGWLTLAGDYGLGKTQLMYAALNHLADQGLYGRYYTAPDLLNQTRDALRDRDGNTHSDLMRRLAETPVLAVDELDKYSPTAYAEEQIFRLFDARYRQRATHITLLAFNLAAAHRLPPFLLSRMRDGRFKYIEIVGEDLRPAAQHEPWDRNEEHYA